MWEGLKPFSRRFPSARRGPPGAPPASCPSRREASSPSGARPDATARMKRRSRGTLTPGGPPAARIGPSGSARKAWPRRPAAERGVESGIPAGERSGVDVGEEGSGASWRGPGHFGGQPEVGEDPADALGVLEGGEQAHAAATAVLVIWSPPFCCSAGGA